MTGVFTDRLAQTLARHSLLVPEQAARLPDLTERFAEPRQLAQELIRRGWLTPYQVNQIFLGREAELRLGKYVLLERLGEGGMGQVYKARQHQLQRLVAIKVIRREFLGHPRAIPRFQREIQLAAQLSHPNIVHAVDAGLVDDTYYFAMEFVDGTRLDRLVRQSGPLRVDQACDYMRQAALGLQHAHERGMVHRDIKPANLIVVRSPSHGSGGASSGILRRPGTGPRPWGTVKILDLGLARGRQADPSLGKLTHVGSLMGTPDYISPEQARGASDCDIRGDLYSLGCTFYYLLAGSLPFPRGSVTEKLFQHQFDESAPVEKVRREVLLRGLAAGDAQVIRQLVAIPRPVTHLVRRLMAKRPEDRFESPGAVATALAEIDAQ